MITFLFVFVFYLDLASQNGEDEELLKELDLIMVDQDPIGMLLIICSHALWTQS